MSKIKIYYTNLYDFNPWVCVENAYIDKKTYKELKTSKARTKTTILD